MMIVSCNIQIISILGNIEALLMLIEYFNEYCVHLDVLLSGIYSRKSIIWVSLMRRVNSMLYLGIDNKSKRKN